MLRTPCCAQSVCHCKPLLTVAVNLSDKTSAAHSDLQQLDARTGGAFSAPTSGERAARLREWLASEPDADALAEVYREMSQRDKGAAKLLKERLDDIRRAKAQDAMAEEWATRARALLAQPRLNLADAMAWQRDAAKAGAPLSREPLASLRQQLADRMKAIEDLQHRVLVAKEAAVLLAQRIEVLSTKSWLEAQAALDLLRQDVANWQAQAEALMQDAGWASLEPRHQNALDGSRQQLGIVWEAFEAALAQAIAAAADPQAPLPAVPVWADELRAARGEVVPAAVAAVDPTELAARQAQALRAVTVAMEALDKELAEGHVKAAPKAAAQLRQALKEHGRHIPAAVEAQAQALLAKSGELEGWQRWRADQLREELLAKAVALTQSPEGQRLGGRKMQETLRQLREQWKTVDQGGAPNHALWKKFDEACNEAHKVVEAWLGQLKQQNEANRAQRLALIEEVKAWTAAHADATDWKQQVRDLHAFSERWRQAGHLSEKLFAEVHPLWKAAMAQAHERLEAAQAESVQRRQALIEEARQLAQSPALRVDAVKALQQRWQQEAHAVPLDRRQEQKLWEAFRQPIDEAFARKSAARDKAVEALHAHDQAVLDAVRALETATASGDAQQIRSAMAAVQAAMRQEAMTPAQTGADPAPAAEPAADAPTDATLSQAAPRKLVAMRGDDRPGVGKGLPAARPAGRDAEASRQRPDRSGGRALREPRGPRLSDAVFRAQRQAMEQADQVLRKLAAQAHGEALMQLLDAWRQRAADAVPPAQALGGKAVAAARASWVNALAAAPSAEAQARSAESLLRLEIAADVPTPAAHLDDRRALQLKLLTRRHDPAPADTWAQDVATVLSSAYEAQAAKRLQAALKALLRR